MPYISAQVVLDATRKPDWAHRNVGVSVCHGELTPCDSILMGDSTSAAYDDCGGAAMPGQERPSSATLWDKEPQANLVAPLGPQLTAKPNKVEKTLKSVASGG